MQTSLGRQVKGVGGLVVVSAVAVSSAILASPASAAVTTATFSTPGSVIWRVPTGVRSIVVEASGASGGTAWSGQSGGLGGRTRATLPVTPGEDLLIVVGGAGGNAPQEEFRDAAAGSNGGGIGAAALLPTLGNVGFGGGGGGGASDVRRSPFGLGQRLVVGAGGGGGSLTCIGGAGGGLVGGSSPNCNHWSGSPGLSNLGGFGGPKENDFCCATGQSGDFGRGGNGAHSGGFPGTGEGVGGGGGGGGWFGGGGGGGGLHVPNSGISSIGGGSGGGGSSHADPSATNVAMTSGVRGGNGLVTISYAMPEITSVVTPAPNANGWNNSNVAVTFNGFNPGGPAVASIGWSTVGTQSFQLSPGWYATVPVTAEGQTTVHGFARDAMGNDSPWTSVNVKVDKTLPGIALHRSVPANTDGWNRTDVTVSYTCTDALSGVASCTSPTTLSTDGFGQTANGFVSDRAGNVVYALSGFINIDKTPPTITGSRTPAPNSRGWNNTDVTVSWTCGDALSGVGACPPPTTLSMEGAGLSVTDAAADRAGNSTSGTVANISIDKTPPKLGKCDATDVTDSRAVIRWTTSEPADSEVEYGVIELRRGRTGVDPTLTTTHATTLQGLKPGTRYSVVARSSDIAGNLATCEFTFRTNSLSYSLRLDGMSAFAEAAHANDLNATGDWTVELWFKDEDPLGFNHDYVTLLNKGDRQNNSESPYVVTLGYGQLLVGLRSGWQDYTVSYQLTANSVSPASWHHVAASFERSSRTLIVYFDGARVSQGQLSMTTLGNTLPLQMGRNGPGAGLYFHGKLDDVRIWDIVRDANAISSDYRKQLAPAPSGLVANWQFEEGMGLIAADTHGQIHNATLSAGSAFSSDHP
jgi:hypothetical protein